MFDRVALVNSPFGRLSVRYVVSLGLRAGRACSTAKGYAVLRSSAVTASRALITLALAVALLAAGTVTGIATEQASAAGTKPLTSGQRIVAVAKRYVGKVRYTEGGASPKRGFDCSGFTKYVYRVAHVAKLPHNAEAQRRMKHMHRVSARHAKPGDLVFYSKPAFHVAIYAGKHQQYVAATSGTKIKKQKIWSSDVTYGRYKK